MPRQILKRPAAKRDLIEHFVFIGEGSQRAAFPFLEAARATFEELAAMPEMGSSQEFAKPKLAGIRRWRIRNFENYLIFYRPLPDGIDVVRVIHAAQDIQSIFES